MGLLHKIIFLLALLVSPLLGADQGLWQAVISDDPAATTQQKAAIQKYQVDATRLTQLLSQADRTTQSEAGHALELPMANGQIQKFSLQESIIMEAGLAAKYPGTKTFKLYGIDDPQASGRVSISAKGFHGMITSPSGTTYIDPEGDGIYRVVWRESQQPLQAFSCTVEGHSHQRPVGGAKRLVNRTAGFIREYRLAVAGSAEYVSRVGGSVAAAQDEIVIAINRVNQIFERDLGIRLLLVDDNDLLLYTDADSDPYTYNSIHDNIIENQITINSVIGAANYDIGHLFTVRGGGKARNGSVCNDGIKAQGVTGLAHPQGDYFYIDYVAHELGHQFGAEHTFNGTTASCGAGNRVASSAFEPGSGSTIMAYAGLCETENLQIRADALFHAGSIDAVDYFTTSGQGASCGQLRSADNAHEPIADAGHDVTIPRKTPFLLEASATDADGDSLSYNWFQMDSGTATNTSTLGFDLTDNALFRTYPSRSHPRRHFPALGTTLNNQFDDSEVLACKTRDLHFRLVVSDSKSGMAHDEVTVSVDNGSGPFKITSFNTEQSLDPGTYTLTWDVANTDRAPVNCHQVDISLLTFNSVGSSYSETLLSTAVNNDGSTTITIPENYNRKARFKIQCSTNIFYDISDVDLEILGGMPFDIDDNPVFYNSRGLVIFNEPAEVCDDTVGSDSSMTESSTEDSKGDSGSLDLYTLLGLLFIGFIRRRLIL